MSPSSAVIIGAGVGGIATAAHLARHGFTVRVVEKNARPGGRLDHFWRDGHHFDTGPTLLVMPRAYRDEFACLGTSLDQEVDLVRVDPTYHIVFDDGDTLALTADGPRMRHQLEAIEPGSYAAHQRYLKEAGTFYSLAMAILVNRQPRLAADLLSLRLLPLLLRPQAFRSHYRHMDAFFSHPRLKAAFTFQDVYMGLSPFEAPSIFSMLPYSELEDGVFFPRGGMTQVVTALMRIATRAGAEFEFNAPVERIDVADGSARGVAMADGRHLTADVIIANADLPYVYQTLLPPSVEAASLRQKRYSCSVISFFWGIDRRLDGLGPHTLFLSDAYRKTFDEIDLQRTLPERPSIYVHAPSRLDPALAPPGQDTLTAIVPVGHLDPSGTQDWPALRDRARRAALDRLAQTQAGDITPFIKFETCFTPPTWRERFNLVHGSTHGLSHNLQQMGYFRPANRHPRIRNVYFVGASTHPGSGVPTAMISARLTARRVISDRG